jgi:hypothetical protein
MSVQGPVDKADSLGDERVDGFLRLERSTEPARGVLLGLEGLEGADRRGS